MKKRSKIITVSIILALVLVFGVQLYIIWGLTIPLVREKEENMQRASVLEDRIADYEHMLAHTDDPEVIRRIAEELLGLISPNEIIITGSYD